MLWLVGQMALAERVERDPEAPLRSVYVAPELPDGVEMLSDFDFTCTVHLNVDRKGHPTRVEADGCPQAFASKAIQAAWSSAYEPWLVEGVAVRTQHTDELRFLSKDHEGWQHVVVGFPGLVAVDLGPALELARPEPPEGAMFLEAVPALATKPDLSFPRDAKGYVRDLGVNGWVSCHAMLTVDEGGAVVDVDPFRCPDFLVEGHVPTLHELSFAPQESLVAFEYVTKFHVQQ